VIIIGEFQLHTRKVIVLSVSKEWCVFHVDDMRTSTEWRNRGVGSVSCGRM